ncbi:hypothetical protein KIL84_008221 [Mauremys mutica]|uniref:Uncharacterized protein n=1 Tax=Mauremys mutica TaxID=74926 RepID=A0A9D4AT78_9SAUR|nr:hypothetical protein KIL84_008221 [Mauremys mutica]
MNPTISIAVILTVLQVTHCQRIKELSACLLGQNLRVDCRYENKTSNFLNYDFSMFKENRKRVIQSNLNVAETGLKLRSNITLSKDMGSITDGPRDRPT